MNKCFILTMNLNYKEHTQRHYFQFITTGNCTSDWWALFSFSYNLLLVNFKSWSRYMHRNICGIHIHGKHLRLYTTPFAIHEIYPNISQVHMSVRFLREPHINFTFFSFFFREIKNVHWNTINNLWMKKNKRKRKEQKIK